MYEENSNLFELFARLQWLLHKYHLRNHKHHGPMGDPHRGQGRVLALLKLQPEISQKELTYLLDMRPQSLGELLAKLERSGYIERTPSESDRRIMNIRLTEEGANTADEQPKMGTMFDCLNEKEQESLSEYLSRIIEGLEKQFSESGESGFEWHGDFDEREMHLREMGHRHRMHHFMKENCHSCINPDKGNHCE